VGRDVDPGEQGAAGFRSHPDRGAAPWGACSVPHWGYVVEGSLTNGYTDGASETIGAGELFHFPAGHSQFGSTDGARWIEISPAVEMAEVVSQMMELIARSTEG
jgi:hypothetical protein